MKTTRARRFREWLFILAGVSIIGGTILVEYSLIQAMPRRIILVLFSLAGLFVAYFIAAWSFRKLGSAQNLVLAYLIVVAILGRLILIPGFPVLSDDIYRYLWDGRVIMAGINPYRYAPADPALESLRDEHYAQINHRQVPTIYPPLAQVLFAAGAAISTDIRVEKLIFVGFDLLTILILIRFLIKQALNPLAVVIYAWNPLIMVEFAHSGHLDSAAIFFLILGICLFREEKPVLAWMSLGLSVLVKYFALLLLPFLLRRHRHGPGMIAFLMTVLAGYALFYHPEVHLFSSVKLYGMHWEHNSLLFLLWKVMLGNPALIRSLLLISLVTFCLVQAFRQESLADYCYLVIGFSLCFTTTVHPWYVCWIVPFLCVRQNRGWLLFTGLVMLSYLTLLRYHTTGEWSMPLGYLLLEYLPFYGVLILDYGLYRQGRTNHASIS